MKCSNNKASSPFKAIIFLVAAVMALAALLSSCQSPQERKGASAIPINKPATWEDGMTTTPGFTNSK